MIKKFFRQNLAAGLFLAVFVSFLYNIYYVYKLNLKGFINPFIVLSLCKDNLIFFISLFLLLFFLLSFINKKNYWQKSTFIVVLLVSFIIFILQFFVLSYEQKILEAKKIYYNKKIVTPFLNSLWEKYIYKEDIFLFNPKSSVSIIAKNKKLIAVDIFTGKTLWKKKILHNIKKENVLFDEDKMIFFDDMTLYILNVFDSNIIFEKKLKDLIPNSDFNFYKDIKLSVNSLYYLFSLKGKEKLHHIILINKNNFSLVNTYKLEIEDTFSILSHKEQFLFFEFSTNKIVVVDSKSLTILANIEDYFLWEKTDSKIILKGNILVEKLDLSNILILTDNKIILCNLDYRKIIFVTDRPINKDLNKKLFAVIKYLKNNILVFDNGYIYLISKDNGKFISIYKNTSFLLNPVIVKNKIYVVANEDDGIINVFEGENLVLLYKWGEYKKFREFMNFKNIIIFIAKNNLGFRKIFAFKI